MRFPGCSAAAAGATKLLAAEVGGVAGGRCLERAARRRSCLKAQALGQAAECQRSRPHRESDPDHTVQAIPTTPAIVDAAAWRNTLASVASPVIQPAVWARTDSRPFVVLGIACVVGGGLVSAAMAPAATYHSSWAVAYIVLIAGVAQAALGLGQAALRGGHLSRRVLYGELTGWNLGNAAVVVGTLLDVTPALYAGCALLVAALAILLHAIRDAPPGWALSTTRVIVALLLISMPVGIVLQAVTQ